MLNAFARTLQWQLKLCSSNISMISKKLYSWVFLILLNRSIETNQHKITSWISRCLNIKPIKIHWIQSCTAIIAILNMLLITRFNWHTLLYHLLHRACFHSTYFFLVTSTSAKLDELINQINFYWQIQLLISNITTTKTKLRLM